MAGLGGVFLTGDEDGSLAGDFVFGNCRGEESAGVLSGPEHLAGVDVDTGDRGVGGIGLGGGAEEEFGLSVAVDIGERVDDDGG
ncbi:MAG: hypothetical protein RI897_3409 [Verrucomicrobiota bacterium]